MMLTTNESFPVSRNVIKAAVLMRKIHKQLNIITVLLVAVLTQNPVSCRGEAYAPRVY